MRLIVEKMVMAMAMISRSALIAMLIVVCGIGAVEAANILVATEPSGFKNRLVDTIVERFEEREYNVTRINHTKRTLDEESVADYDVVLIVNAGVNSRVRPWVTTWMDTVEDTEKIILVTTYRDEGWEPKFPDGVDSITTPSRRGEVAELTTAIEEKVDALLAAGAVEHTDDAAEHTDDAAEHTDDAAEHTDDAAE